MATSPDKELCVSAPFTSLREIPLRASSGYGRHHDIFGVNKDTSVHLLVLPDQVNYIQFNITNPDSAKYYNVRTDTILFSGFADTFFKTFQLDPRTFPKR